MLAYDVKSMCVYFVPFPHEKHGEIRIAEMRQSFFPCIYLFSIFAAGSMYLYLCIYIYVCLCICVPAPPSVAACVRLYLNHSTLPPCAQMGAEPDMAELLKAFSRLGRRAGRRLARRLHAADADGDVEHPLQGRAVPVAEGRSRTLPGLAGRQRRRALGAGARAVREAAQTDGGGVRGV